MTNIKRQSAAFAALIFAAVPLSASPDEAPFQPYDGPLMRAAQFVDAEGVTTHIAYNDGGYADLGEIIHELKYLGIDRVRDAVNAPGANGSPKIEAWWTVARAGIKFNFVVGGGEFGRTSGTWSSPSLEERVDNIHWLERAVPGCVVSIEGPNEINNEPVVYEGLGRSRKGEDALRAALALQRDLFALVRNDSRLKAVPVLYFTGYGAGKIPLGPDPAKQSGLADFNNQHPYPRNGEPPAAWITRRQALPNGSAGPAVYTETGYPSNTDEWNGVPEDVQAIYTLELLLDAAREGVAATYLYELMDAYPPGSRQGNAGFGLFDYRHRPKPVAQALHNLNYLLRDPAADARSFVLEPLALAHRAGNAKPRMLVLQASKGRYVIAIWNELRLFDRTKGGRIKASTIDVELAFENAYTAALYDPVAGAEAIQTSSSVKTLPLRLGERPLFVLLNPGASTP